MQSIQSDYYRRSSISIHDSDSTALLLSLYVTSYSYIVILDTYTFLMWDRPIPSGSVNSSSVFTRHSTRWCRSTSLCQQLLHGISTKHCTCITVRHPLMQSIWSDYDRRSSISTHRNHKTPIVIGAVTGSLVFLLIILGGGTFLFIRKRRYGKWNLKHHLSPNPKIIPQPNLHSPPVRNKNRETISPRREGDMTVNLGDRSWETVEHSQEGNSTEVERERRNSIGAPDTLESQSVQQEDVLDVVNEVLRLRNHVQQIIEGEPEGVQGNLLDPPPAYV